MLFPEQGLKFNMELLRDEGKEANEVKRGYYPGEDWNPKRAVRESLVILLDDGTLGEVSAL